MVISLASAQPAAPAAPAAASGAAGTMLTGVEAPIISETYILEPGDQLLVTLNGSVAYSYYSWVTYEGKLGIQIPDDFTNPKTLQTVDVVRVSGLNMKNAQDTLALTFRRYLRDATIKLTLTSLRSGVVYVAGEVLEPGAIYATPVDRVSQIITRAGGVTAIGSRTKIRILRGDKVLTTIDLEKFENSGDLSANPFVESGDRIFVPPVSGMVTVKGALFGRGDYRLRTSALTTEKERVSEGLYELTPGEHVTDLITKAGGTTPWADLRVAYVTRRAPTQSAPTNIPIDLVKVLYQGDTADNIELQSADIVVVPPINTLVYVEGEVNKPTSYLYTPNLRFTDYVGMAGGPAPNGNMDNAVITRGKTRLTAASNPVIEPGDIVYVPRLNLRWWQDYLTIFSAIGMPVATTILSIYLASKIK